jgi:hypothetical protein
MLRHIKNWLRQKPDDTFERYGKALIYIGFGFFAMAAVGGYWLSASSQVLVVSVGCGLGASFVALGVGTYLDPRLTRYPNMFQRRTDARDVMQRIMGQAIGSEGGLRLLAVAGTDFFAVGQLYGHFSKIVHRTKTRVLLMDPASPAAQRRHVFESPRGVDTLGQIKASLEAARLFADRSGGKMDVKTCSDPSFFLLFNDIEMLVQPYFVTKTGHETYAVLVRAGDPTFEMAKKHFEELWDRDRVP